MLEHPARKTLITLLFIEEIASESAKVFRFHQGCSPGSTMKLTGINNLAINLVENKQTLSGPGNKLGEAGNSEDLHQDLANGIIRPSMS